MKKLFLILFLLPLFISGQTLNLNNNQIKLGGDTAVVIDGNLKADTIFSTNCHADTLVFSDGTKQSTAATGGGASYLKYVAILTQSGTDAPVATVFENTLGATVVWTYVTEGVYSSNTLSVLDRSKTFLVLTNNYGDANYIVQAYCNAANAVEIYAFDISTGLGTNELLYNTPIEIRVYP